MGQLVFQATLGGQVNLVGPNTASTFNINVPAVAGNMVTTGDTGTVTNTMLAGSIANAKLTNSSVTVGSTAISLGGTATTIAGLTSLATNTLTSAAATALTIQSAGTTAITVDTSQNVGIGTSSPTYKIEARSDTPAFFASTSGDGTRFGYTTALPSNSGNCYVGWIPDTVGTGGVNGDLALQPRTSAGGNIRFFTGSTSATERGRFDSSGNFLIGQTGQNSTEKFGVTFAAGNAGIYTKVASTATQYHLTFNNGSVVGAISTNGSLTTYSVSSDYRLKDNVVPLTGALEKIAQMKPSLYNYKADPTTQIEGFIAHELQEVVPHAVVGEKDAVDADGNPVYQGVDASFLIPHLVAAVQELAAKVTALEAK